MASKLGIGLLGAAMGIGGTLNREYERQNEEATLIRREGRTTQRMIDKEGRDEATHGREIRDSATVSDEAAQLAEARREQYTIAAEGRKLQNDKTAGIISNELKMQLTVAEDNYARERLLAGDDVATIRADITAQRDVNTSREKHEGKLDVDRLRNAENIPTSISRSESKSDKNVSVYLNGADARREFNVAMNNVTGFNGLKDAVGDERPSIVSRLKKGNADLADIIGNEDTRTQYRAELAYMMATDAGADLALEANAKSITSEAQLTDRATDIISKVDALLEALDKRVPLIQAGSPEQYREWALRKVGTTNLSVALKGIEELQRQGLKRILGEEEDKTDSQLFKTAWAPYGKLIRERFNTGR